jgi:hypothetical protein
MAFWQRMWSGLRHAFAMPSRALSADDEKLLDDLAQEIVRRRLDAAALFSLQAALPLSFLGSQFLYILRPWTSLLYDLGATRQQAASDELTKVASQFLEPGKYERLVLLFERRDNIERLLDLIEDHAALRSARPAAVPGK